MGSNEANPDTSPSAAMNPFATSRSSAFANTGRTIQLSTPPCTPLTRQRDIVVIAIFPVDLSDKGRFTMRLHNRHGGEKLLPV